ncbi:hypothetical protein H6F43_16460 [Leptolyngbya sp. FACHB-36]|nr:hypothetical protein [Leptolyngbya sp. FACHB-36]
MLRSQVESTRDLIAKHEALTAELWAQLQTLEALWEEHQRQTDEAE